MPEYSKKQLDGFQSLAKEMIAFLPKVNTPEAIQAAHDVILEKFGYSVTVFFNGGEASLGFGETVTDDIFRDFA